MLFRSVLVIDLQADREDVRVFLQELLHVAVVNALLQEEGHVVFVDKLIKPLPVCAPVPGLNAARYRPSWGLDAVEVLVVAELPKTRSGKIMRRLLRDVAENRQVGDATTLADPNVMKLIQEGLASGKTED